MRRAVIPSEARRAARDALLVEEKALTRAQDRLAHLHARDASLVFVSRAPMAEVAALRARMGWAMPWVSTADGFDADHDVAAGCGLDVLHRGGGAIWRTWRVAGREIETLGTIFTLLDVTRLGRRED